MACLGSISGKQSVFPLSPISNQIPIGNKDGIRRFLGADLEVLLKCYAFIREKGWVVFCQSLIFNLFFCFLRDRLFLERRNETMAKIGGVGNFRELYAQMYVNIFVNESEAERSEVLCMLHINDKNGWYVCVKSNCATHLFMVIFITQIDILDQRVASTS